MSQRWTPSPHAARLLRLKRNSDPLQLISNGFQEWRENTQLGSKQTHQYSHLSPSRPLSFLFPLSPCLSLYFSQSQLLFYLNFYICTPRIRLHEKVIEQNNLKAERFALKCFAFMRSCLLLSLSEVLHMHDTLDMCRCLRVIFLHGLALHRPESRLSVSYKNVLYLLQSGATGKHLPYHLEIPS